MDFFDKLTFALFVWAFLLCFASLPAFEARKETLGRKLLTTGLTCAVGSTLSFLFG